jgi:hypothetical protein
MALPDINDPKIHDVASEIARGFDGPRHLQFVRDGGFFAHYTSAEACKAILDGKSFLMRNTRLMNDHSEVRHGLEIVAKALSRQAGREYLDQCDKLVPGSHVTIFRAFDEARNKIQNEVFILSLSAHREPADRNGRLSMWRAYGDGDIRVALIGRPLQVLTGIDRGILAAPVVYGDLAEVEREIRFKAELLDRHHDTLKPATDLEKTLFGLLVNLAVSIKHDGFSEEQEWRLSYMPQFASPGVERTRSALVLGGIPQVVYRIPFILPGDEGYQPDRLMLEKAILGPCPEPETVRAGLVELLRSKGFQNADQLVFSSSIPYRRRM